jgi:hypothetical protein
MVGQQLGHYKILGKLGEGGMEEVCRAEVTSLTPPTRSAGSDTCDNISK